VFFNFQDGGCPPCWTFTPRAKSDIYDCLLCSADGKFEVQFQSNILIFNNGYSMWIPCTIYKSSCTLDVQYFPFDEQQCKLIFGSWTYSGNEVRLKPYTDRFRKVSGPKSCNGAAILSQVRAISKMVIRAKTEYLNIAVFE